MMKKIVSGALLLSGCAIMMVAGCSTNAQNTGGGQALLLVAFGTTYEQALPAYENVEEVMRRRFPDRSLRWAYTSNMIRRILAERGDARDSPGQALKKLANQGFSDVAVQSLHVIPGYEYDELKAAVLAYEGRFEKLAFGAPLLNSHEDVEIIVDHILRNTPEREQGEALVLMGHGSHHAAGLLYVAFDALLREQDPLAFAGAVEGYPDLEFILAQCREAGVARVLLLPFMVVAGDHARNDMGGGGPESWDTVFRQNGIEARSVFRGLTELDGPAELFADHLEQALAAQAHN